MTRGGRRDWRTIGCAALLGASIAFPAGLFLGGSGTPREQARQPSRPGPSAVETRSSRNLYSPRIGSDPYVVEQQRKVLRALEAGCRQLGQNCAEAEQARLRIGEAESLR